MDERQLPTPERPVAEELAELRRELAVIRARLDRPTERPRRRGRLAPLLSLGIVALLVALVPIATLAANPFTDLNSGSPHNSNIDAIYTAGITTGCGPTSYCPNGTVTREEMASFLARTAGLGGNPPVANATTAQSATTAQTALNATNAQNAVNAQSAVSAQTAVSAQNAAQLGGQPASAYIRRGASDFAVLTTNQAAGPLPRSFTFTSHGGRLLIFASGSAFATATGAIGVRVQLDGTSIGLMQISANELSSHKALAPIMVSRVVPAGNHTITFAVNPDQAATDADNYDVYNLTVLELPIP